MLPKAENKYHRVLYAIAGCCTSVVCFMELASCDFEVSGFELLAVLTGLYLSVLFFFQALSKVEAPSGAKLLTFLIVGTILIGLAESVQGVAYDLDMNSELRDITRAIEQINLQ